MISLTFSGGQELAKAINALPSAVSIKVQREALAAGAEPMRAEAEVLAPRGPDAPHIADNIIISIPRTGLADVSDEAAVVAVGPDKKYFYGFFWEFGWRYHSAHPFMRPAFDTKGAECVAIIGKQLWASIAKSAERMFTQQAQASGTSHGGSSGGGLL